MNNKENIEGFSWRAENSNLETETQAAADIIKNVSSIIETEHARLERVIGNFGERVISSSESDQIGNFIADVLKLREEFEKTEKSLTVLLGSEKEAEILSKELQKYAFESSMEFGELAEQTVQLLIFGNESQNLIELLDKLSVVAITADKPLTELVELYNKAKVQGQLFIGDIQKWEEMGVPILQILAREFNKTEQDINQMAMTAKIDLEDLNSVLSQITLSYGSLRQDLEKKAGELTKGVALLSDAWDRFIKDTNNNIQEFSANSLSASGDMEASYERLGKILDELIAMHGNYKIALTTLTLLLEEQKKAINGVENSNMSFIETLMAQAVGAELAKRELDQLMSTMSKNKYVAIAVGVVAVATALWKLRDATTAQQKAQEKFNKISEETREKKQSLENNTFKLTSIINDETKSLVNHVSAYRELQELYPDLLKNMDIHSFKMLSVTEQQKLFNKAITEQETEETIQQYKTQIKVVEELSEKLESLKEEREMYLDSPKSLSNLSNRISNVMGELAVEKELLEELKKKKSLREEDQKMAELIGLPEDKRLEVLQQELGALKNQRDHLEILINRSERLNTVLGEVDPIFKGWQESLIIVNDKIQGIESSMSIIADNGTTKNKSYWEEERKKAKAKWDSIDEKDLNSEEAQTAKAEYNRANSKLMQWDTLTKNLTWDNASDKQLEAQKWLKQKDEEFKKEKEKIELEFESQSIALWKDSFKKRKAIAENEYKSELLAIEEQVKEMIKVRQEYERKEWIADGKGEKDFISQTISENDLPEEQRKAIENARSLANQKKGKTEIAIREEEEKVFKEAELKFGDSLAIKLNQIEEYYKERLQKAEKNEELIAILEKNKKREIEQAHIEAELAKIDFDHSIATRRMALSNKFYLFESDKEKKLIEEKKKTTKEKLDLLKGIPEDLRTEEQKKQIEEAEVAVEEFEDQLEKLSLKKFQEILEYTDKIGKGISELFGDSSAGVGIGVINDIASGVGGIAVGFMTMNPKAIIDGVFNLAGSIKNIIKLNKEANKEIKEFAYSLEQAAIKYSIALIRSLKDIDTIRDSLFYEDKENRLTQGMTAYSEAVKKERELTVQLGNTTVEVEKKKKKFMGITTGTKSVYDNLLTGYKKVLNTEEELIDANGKLNREIAESLLNSGKLSKEATDLINNILSAADAAEEAIKQVEAVISELAGNVGQDLKNALVEAFKEGTDAAEMFKDSVTSIMEDIISEFLFAQYFGEILNQLEERMAKSYSTTGDKDLIDDLIWFASVWEANQEKFDKEMKRLQEEMEKKGFSLFAGSSAPIVTAQAKGIATASQDSVDELHGTFTAIQTHTYHINQNVQLLTSNSNHILTHLSGIQTNTEHCKRLAAIETDMSAVKSGIEFINLHGIELRR